MTALALAVLVATVFLEDVQETIAHHSGGIFAGWWYAENRWRHKYKDPSGPYAWGDRKWWSKVGLGAFIDLWHAAKTARVILFCALIVLVAGLPWWWTALGWFLYGGLHDHLFYGRLLK